MSAEYFLDTNLFIYHVDDADHRKQEIAAGIIRQALDSGRGCISYQVVQECLNVMLRKASQRLDVSYARRYLEDTLEPLIGVPNNASLYHRALDIHARYQFHFYDSLIVAGALVAGCKTLFSEDLQDGQRIESLTITNPFV